jgi:two-component system cell cycle sensor histidine kinase/response regulator CckA
VRQVVMNMITNASDALGEKSGVIMIRTGAMFATDDYLHSSYVSDSLEPGTYAYVEVSDTGKGMDEKTLTQIFEPFFTTKFTGRGLGLAAVLGIVRGHKGSIRVYSEPGKGTTFKVLFPCSAQTPIPLQQNEGFDPDWRGQGRVLVVDDEDTVRAVAQNILRRFGFECTLVANGRQGLEAFASAPDTYRLVLMDLTMPEMSGEELFRELRLLRPDVKVILTSGYNEQEATNHFVGKGLAAFLQKPFTPAELITTIRQTLGE